ncbi:putative methyltransferase [Fibrobacter succinogenes subsp. succinogenes S85]|uniref:tRNA (guanine(46)-N(7))-methyltransferase n=1 Tax=Fibrobacter succinogenes (strain ATCC 19169 / S85) TaxID=59374 RepID=A0ABN3YTA3_FIBSS|nr:methyltransferase domain-containing protein [Fibrobacter succinogenes]ACX74744.1 putative methyltransferase [Fibrobacter succinogenes subsp. succinogenes S85]
MSGANSVTSNQETLHKDLEEVVRKYARTTFLRPIADHTREAFAEVEEFVRKFYATRNADPVPAQGRDDMMSGVTSVTRNADNGTAPRAVILDSGCGTGESTIHIARRFPGIPVIGIDKSCARLNKAGNPSQTAGEDVPANAFWIRAELLDFWRLALDYVKACKWTIPYHAVYYPNPWPKQSEATRRFHMHPIFPTLLALGKTIELRTNWEIYAREFAEAARIVFDERAEAGMTIKCESFNSEKPETAFERKYKEARQILWRVLVALPQ